MVSWMEEQCQAWHTHTTKTKTFKNENEKDPFHAFFALNRYALRLYIIIKFLMKVIMTDFGKRKSETFSTLPKCPAVCGRLGVRKMEKTGLSIFIVHVG